MFAFTLSAAVSALTALSSLSSVRGLPVETRNGLRTRASSSFAAPHFVLYGDKFVSGTQGPPDASTIEVR